MKINLLLLCIIISTSCSNSKNENINGQSSLKKYLAEIEIDLFQKGYTLHLEEEKIPELEAFLSKLYQEEKINEAYLDKYFFHFLVLIGEIYIQKHGGKWIFNKDHKGQIFPTSIKCSDGTIKSDFFPVLRDVLLFETKVTSLVELQPSYSRINCENNF